MRDAPLVSTETWVAKSLNEVACDQTKTLETSLFLSEAGKGATMAQYAHNRNMAQNKGGAINLSRTARNMTAIRVGMSSDQLLNCRLSSL